MKNALFVLLALMLAHIGLSQEKSLSIQDAVIGSNYHMYPERLSQLQWRPNTQHFTHVEKDELLQENVVKGEKKTLLTLEKLNKSITKEGHEEVKRFPYLRWNDETSVRFYHNHKILVFDIKKKNVVFDIAYNKKAENLDYCETNQKLAYTIKNNLFIVNNEEKVEQVTRDENEEIVNGGNYVHRSEFGILKGTFWSPQGNYLAFYRQDQSMVTDYPLADITQRVAKVENIKYPMAGMKSEEVTIGVYNVKNKETIFLDTGEPRDQYLTNIAWSPDEKSIFVAILNREQNHMQLKQYDANTGRLVKTLLEEKNEKYVEPENPMAFLPDNSGRFIWQSERDGYNHLYLYDTDGNYLKQLTSGPWVVTEFMGFDPNAELAFFVSTERGPLYRDVSVVNINTGKRKLLTQTKGTHNPLFNDTKSHFIDAYSSTEIPRDYYLIDQNGTILRTVFSANNPFEDFNIGEMKIITLKNDDDTKLYARIITPVDFDPNKKYPAIIYVYGGPHSQLVYNSWMGGSRVWPYYMAQKGYVMLTLDNRGTHNRGLEFENCIHRQLGKLEMEDQMKGVEYLKSLPYVDTARIGLHGWSYGGFMTISLMQNHPDVFKVGVAGGPVVDWKYYEVMYGERYMDTPEENPEGYANNRLTDKVNRLKGKLMVINGAIDPVVVWQHYHVFLQSCIENGVPVDYFVYPRAEHNMRGKERIHLMKKVTQYFDDHL